MVLLTSGLRCVTILFLCRQSVPCIRDEADAPNPLGEASGETVGSLGRVLGEAVVGPLIGRPGGGGSRADRGGGAGGGVGGGGRACRDGAGELRSRGAAAGTAVTKSSGSPKNVIKLKQGIL